MVVECTLKHGTNTGDGTKTFIIFLASLLRRIQTTALNEHPISNTATSRERAVTATAGRLADELLTFALQKLWHLICLEVVPYGHCLVLEDCTGKVADSAGTDTLQKLLSSFFHTRVGRGHCDFVADLLCKLLSYWKVKYSKGCHFSLQFVSDSFAVLHTPVSGFPLACSRLIEGQVIHRDFATQCHHTDQPVKAVVVTTCLQKKMLSAEYVIELSGQTGLTDEGNLVRFGAWSESTLECVFAALSKLGVSFLLSAVKQSEAVLALATQKDISVVECVSDDELNLFAHFSKTKPVLDDESIQPEHVATLKFCRPVVLGAHRYVHVDFPDPEEYMEAKAYSVIICGSGEGQTDQYSCAFQDALRMLLKTCESFDSTQTSPLAKTSESGRSCLKEAAKSSTSSVPTEDLDPSWVINAGGTFEFLLYNALMQRVQTNLIDNNTEKPDVYKILATALLSVPGQIYSQRHFLKMQTRFLRSCTSSTSEMLSNVFELDPGLESVSCKYKLVLAVLQCVRSLLRVDTIVQTHTVIHRSTNRLSNISWEVLEDED